VTWGLQLLPGGVGWETRREGTEPKKKERGCTVCSSVQVSGAHGKGRAGSRFVDSTPHLRDSRPELCWTFRRGLVVKIMVHLLAGLFFGRSRDAAGWEGPFYLALVFPPFGLESSSISVVPPFVCFPLAFPFEWDLRVGAGLLSTTGAFVGE
jgi:hypothetical protein